MTNRSICERHDEGVIDDTSISNRTVSGSTLAEARLQFDVARRAMLQAWTDLASHHDVPAVASEVEATARAMTQVVLLA